jgi:hypothetical protein
LRHLGITEHENTYTESRIAISLWQISKLVLEEIVPQVGSVDLLCNIGNEKEGMVRGSKR